MFDVGFNLAVGVGTGVVKQEVFIVSATVSKTFPADGIDLVKCKSFRLLFNKFLPTTISFNEYD